MLAESGAVYVASPRVSANRYRYQPRLTTVRRVWREHGGRHLAGAALLRSPRVGWNKCCNLSELMIR